MTRDLMFTDEIQQLVRDAYEPLQPPGGPAESFYSDEQLRRLPHGARDWALGVGNPLAWAALRPGETVLDLGCGAGIDTLLAARDVGPDGRATGVDFLPSMISRARGFA
jgi:arsenite methyltransferase